MLEVGLVSECVLCGSPVGPPLRWWVPCGALPSVWVSCGVPPPPVGDPLWGPPLRYLTTLLQLVLVTRFATRGLLPVWSCWDVGVSCARVAL